MTQKVVLIGSGKRIQQNFIPTLRCLSDQFEIIGIHSRTPEKLKVVAQRFGLKPIYQLVALRELSPDMVVVSVTSSQVINVLNQLPSTDIILVIDTPVFAQPKDLWALRLLKKFKRVIVAEDYMNFPQFELLRTVCDADAIGKIRYVNLFHSGYEYHGLALIRSFLNFPMVQSFNNIAVDHSQIISGFKFSNHTQGSMIEPYLRCEIGSIVIIGSRGILTDFQHPWPGARPLYRLEHIIERDHLKGFLVSTPEREFTLLLPYVDRLRQIGMDDTSNFNLLKTSGLIAVFESIHQKNINSRYSYLEGAYDQLMSRRTRKQGRRPHPLAVLYTWQLHWHKARGSYSERS